MEDGMTAGAGREVFALTDEQIVGLEEDVTGGPQPLEARGKSATSEKALASGEEDKAEPQRKQSSEEKSVRPEVAASGRQDAGAARAPAWLQERLTDPWHGEEAKEFWEGKQRVEREAAAYREVFATPEDARALKEIYPGGVSEAKSAAERAQTLDEIDAAFYRGNSAARIQLAQRMMAQDPAAFREMVEAAVSLLGEAEGQRFPEARDKRVAREEGSLRSEPSLAITQDKQKARLSDRNDGGLHARAEVSPELVRAYGEFEKSANAELEKSVGGSIARAMEQALPNLRTRGALGGSRPGAQNSVRDDGAGAAPLQERLASAVREEVEAGLKSDRQLGEQVAKLLAGQRFDHDSRAQVVRLIGARAEQLVPGAVKRVVSAWTQTTLAAHGKEVSPRREETVENARAVETRVDAERVAKTRKETARSFQEVATRRGQRVDYGRFSDEEIVGL